MTLPPLYTTLQFIPGQAVPDTTLSPPDTLSLGARLRNDSTLRTLTNPEERAAIWGDFTDIFRDADLWLGLAGTILHMLLIITLVYFGISLVDRAVKQFTKHYEHLPAINPRRQRAYTISNLISSAVRYIAWPIALIMVLSEIGVDVSALIATAGIAGLALGIGAQTLVKDVISGIFLLFDDTIHVGDLVRIGTDEGVVEYIGLRVIRVRRFNGEVMMVPAGELRIFGNRSIDFARVIVEVGLSYEQDLDTILPVMQRVADVWAAERRDILLEDAPLVQAITLFGDSAITARIVIKCLPGEQFQAERDLRLLLKRTFDEIGVEIPFPRRTIYMRQEPDLPIRTIPPPPPLPDPSEPLETD